MLPPNPQLSIVSLPELGLVVLFYTSLGFTIDIQKEKWSRTRILNLIPGIVLFSVALLLSLFAAYPTAKPRAEAEDFTSSHQQAAQSGAQLGELVRRDVISEEAAREQISNQFTEDTTQKLATKTLEQKIATDKTVEEVVEETFPTIPVRYREWTCNYIGCSFADDANVWTISSQARIFAPVLVFVSMLAMVVAASIHDLRKYLLKIPRLRREG